MADPKTLSGSASTAHQTKLKVRPFRVARLVVPKTWDPSSAALKMTYAVSDPNNLIKRGRLRIIAIENEQLLYEIPLSKDSLLHDTDHTEEWDGALPDSFGDRAGERVTAGLGDLMVIVQAWNTDNAEPAKPSGKRGETERKGEWFQQKGVSTSIEIISESKWQYPFCVPYNEMSMWKDEQKYGKVEINIKVKNLPENTPVRIDVCRIHNVDDDIDDTVYASSHEEVSHDDAKKKAPQPGLLNPVVKAEKVCLSDGSIPYVTFNRYERHWAEEGNNFYCFRLYPDPKKDVYQNSERDKLDSKKRKQCLHMRYTVLIIAPASNLPQSKAEARRVRNLLKRKTKYFRPYLILNKRVDYLKYVPCLGYKYMVIFSGHSSTGCDHADHPKIDPSRRYKFLKKKVKGRWVKTKEERSAISAILLDEMFIPYKDWCPPKNVVTKAHKQAYKRMVKKERKAWAKKKKTRPYAKNFAFGWCQHKESVEHTLFLNHFFYKQSSGKKGYGRVYIYNSKSKDGSATLPWIWLERKVPKNKPGLTIPFPADALPRFAFMAEGCRSILTTNLGKNVCDAGTRYFTGWHYTSWDDARLTERTFKRWLKMCSKEKEPEDECNAKLFKEAYLYEAARTSHAKRFPAMMEKGKLLRSTKKQGELEKASK